MLRALGIDRVRLLTNNPDKVAGLEGAGIEVTERVAHQMPANPHNADYLATKRKRSGHLLV
jgi:GTP cyclohydrolase II